MTTTTQNQQILRHLKLGRSITPLVALNRYGCMRIGARIYELRKAGHDIKRDFVTVWRSGKRVAEYFLP